MEITKHVKSHISSGIKTSCFIESCKGVFQNAKTFSAHMSRCHGHRQTPSVSFGQDSEHSFNNAQTSTVTGGLGNQESSSLTQSVEQTVKAVEGPGEASLVTTHLALFFMKLESLHLVPASVVQCVANEMYFIETQARESKVEGISKLLERFDVSPEVCQAVVAELKADESPVSLDSGALRTRHTRSQFYRKNFTVIDPVEVKCGGAKTFHYVPIKKTLSAFLSDKSVQKKLAHADNSEPGYLHDITDGKLYKDSNFFSGEKTIQFLLFQDAFEVVNPLGSARKKHKILGTYYSIANMPPLARTKVHAIQLVMLCYESILQEVGHEAVWERLVSDLLDLEQEGITVDGVKYKCGLLSCLGDNLGSHGIGGFVESFSKSTYFCRFCEVKREEFDADFRSFGSRRTVESHESSLKRIEENLASNLGVKFDSAFNKLQSFHTTSGLPPCIAHDVFEGVVAHDLSLVIKSLVINKKWFTVDELNVRINNIKLKGHDCKNRMCTISRDPQCKVSGEAVRMFYLVIFLPVLLYDRVRDEEDEVWQLYLCLKDIVTMLASPKLHVTQIAYLRVLIDDYLSRRVHLFPDIPLKPKHHYLRHYPDLCYEYGPLSHLSTLRFESKHSYFKRIIRSTRNFKNITYSMATKHEMLQSYCRASQLYADELILEHASSFVEGMYSDDVVSGVKRCGIPLHSAEVSQKLVYRGTVYETDSVIFFMQEGQPLAGKIVCSVVAQQEVVFVVQPCELSTWANMGLKVVKTCAGIISCVPYSSLLDFSPVYTYTCGARQVVSLKHDVEYIAYV